MRKTASKRHDRRKMSKKYRMTKRVRKSRQSRKRNMYVGGGVGFSAMSSRNLPNKTIAFNAIKTPNITYWDETRKIPFAVHLDLSTFGRSGPIYNYIIAKGMWGHNTYSPDDGGFNTYDVFKNFNQFDTTEYDELPRGKPSELPSGEVTNYTPYAADVTIGGVKYPKYDEAIHNPPQRMPGVGEGISAPLLQPNTNVPGRL